jgi:flagellar motor switch/type III secretory pathway protein FliN
MMTLYKPAQLSQCDIDVLQELILSKRVFPVFKENKSQGIRFLRGNSFTKKNPHFSISLDINKEKVDVTLQPTLESSLAHRLLELGDIESFPHEFVAAIRACYSKEIINAVESFFEMPIGLWTEGGAPLPTTETRELFFEFIQNDSVVETQGSIKMPLVLLKKLLSLATEIPAMKDVHFKNLSVEGEILVGTVSLSLENFKKITPGALLFLKEPCPIVTGAVFLLFEKNQKIPIVIDLKQLTQLVIPLPKISFAPFTPDPPLGPDKEDVCNEEVDSEKKSITMELSFSAGAISITLEELLLLAKNKKMNQPVTLRQSLKILAHGKHVGTGVLTSVHDQHALFITQLL